MNGGELLGTLPDHAFKRDNSRMALHRTCRMKYFLIHVMGWSRISEIHRDWGNAYHRSQKHFRDNGFTRANLLGALQAFNKKYDMHYGPEDEEGNKPKNKEAISTALEDRLALYSEWELKNQCIKTEEGFSFEIAPDRWFYGRKDAKYWINDLEPFGIQGEGLVIVDDKSTKENRRYWIEQFDLMDQMTGYLTHEIVHAHHESVPWKPEDVRGAMIDAIHVRPSFRLKKDHTPDSRRKDIQYCGELPLTHNYSRFIVQKREDQIREWIWKTNKQWDELDADYQALEKVKESDEFMPCFQRNDQACTLYGRRCEFMTECKLYTNPLRLAETVPQGYEIKYWDPEASIEDKQEY